MRTKLGREIKGGDEVKLLGRWFTILFIVREFEGGNVYTGRMTSCSGGPKRTSFIIQGDASYQCRRSIDFITFNRWQPVWITYSDSIPRRRGTVMEDNGEDKVLVRWRASDGPKVGRHVVLYHGREHEQRIARDRLEAF